MAIKKILAAAATSLILSAPAHAAFITGAISFADGLDGYNTTTWIVSQLNAIDDAAATPEAVNGCTGDFATPPGSGICNPVVGNLAFDFTIGPAGQLVYLYNGFSFVIDGFSPVTRNPLTCFANGCGDSLLFDAFGTVSGNGFFPTGFTMSFTAQGRCTQLGPNQIECDPSTVSASWSSSIAATGRAPFIVPEPQTAALLGLGLVALALIRRRRPN